jgi:hypothetical protein
MDNTFATPLAKMDYVPRDIVSITRPIAANQSRRITWAARLGHILTLPTIGASQLQPMVAVMGSILTSSKDV